MDHTTAVFTRVLAGMVAGYFSSRSITLPVATTLQEDHDRRIKRHMTCLSYAGYDRAHCGIMNHELEKRNVVTDHGSPTTVY